MWDPLFAKNKGGKIDFVELFKQAKTLRIKEDALNQFKDFQENYQEITDNCIESPAIDTRTQK